MKTCRLTLPYGGHFGDFFCPDGPEIDHSYWAALGPKRCWKIWTAAQRKRRFWARVRYWRGVARVAAQQTGSRARHYAYPDSDNWHGLNAIAPSRADALAGRRRTLRLDLIAAALTQAGLHNCDRTAEEAMEIYRRWFGPTYRGILFDHAAHLRVQHG